MQILPKTNPSETKVTNTGVSKPPQIGGSTVSRSRGLENNFFLHPKPFSENSRTGDSKNVWFLRFQPFLAKKMALEVKKARFNPFVLPSDFVQSQMGTLSSQWQGHLLSCTGQLNNVYISVMNKEIHCNRSHCQRAWQACITLHSQGRWDL